RTFDATTRNAFPFVLSFYHKFVLSFYHKINRGGGTRQMFPTSANLFFHHLGSHPILSRQKNAPKANAFGTD
ncbi:hypothetical protein P4S88_16810, partial [Anoxybacillus geothermalis]|nr:hypothetical protein [Anoxybacillus geothermalis]